MNRLRRALTITVIAGTALTTFSAPVGATGVATGGYGAQYLLNDALSGNANTEFIYGNPDDQVYFGDWNGDRRDTPMVVGATRST